MRGEVQQYGTVAPSQEEYESGLRDRPVDIERSWTLARIVRQHAPEPRTEDQGQAVGIPAPTRTGPCSPPGRPTPDSR